MLLSVLEAKHDASFWEKERDVVNTAANPYFGYFVGIKTELIVWVKESEKQGVHPVIVAGVLHQEIAAIHPFADGNGRTARALATLVFYQRGFGFRRLFALEDYYNKERPAYYKTINIGENYERRKAEITPWLEYFVKGFREEIDNVRTKVTSLSLRKIDDKLHAQIYLDKDRMKILEFLDQMGRIAVSDVVDILECPICFSIIQNDKVDLTIQ